MHISADRASRVPRFVATALHRRTALSRGTIAPALTAATIRVIRLWTHDSAVATIHRADRGIDAYAIALLNGRRRADAHSTLAGLGRYTCNVACAAMVVVGVEVRTDIATIGKWGVAHAGFVNTLGLGRASVAATAAVRGVRYRVYTHCVAAGIAV